MSETRIPPIQITTTGIRPFWPFLAGLAIGIIIGVLAMSGAASALRDNEIRAGHFESKGIAYRIMPEAQ